MVCVGVIVCCVVKCVDGVMDCGDCGWGIYVVICWVLCRFVVVFRSCVVVFLVLVVER